MAETTDDIYGRLGEIIEDWNFQVVQSHEALSNQIQTARGHLERLIRPVEEQEVAAETTQETIAALEAQVADLTEALQQAQNAPPPAADAVAVETPDTVVDARLAEVQEKLDEAGEVRAALQFELDARYAELANLKAELSAMREMDEGKPDAETPAGDDERIALEEALAEAQSRLVESEARNSDLQVALETTEHTLEKTREEAEAAKDRCVALEAKLADSEQARDAATQDDVGAESDELWAAHETQKEKLAEARRQIESLEASLAEGGRTPSSHDFDGAVHIEAFDSLGHKKRMGEILLELGVLDDEQLKAVLKEQSADPQHRLGTLVVQHGFTGEDIVAKILAAQLRLPYHDIRDMEIEKAAIDAVSPHVTRLHRCVPLKEENGLLTIAMVNPLDLIAIEDIELASHLRVAPVVSTPSQINERLNEFYGAED